MKKAGIALLLLFATTRISAQITLNQSDMAGPGDVIINSSQNYTGTTPPAGANISYSFTESDTTIQDTTVFIAASSTPFIADMPAGTNMATASFGNYSFFKLDNTGLYATGLVFDFQGGGGLGLPFSSAIFPINPPLKFMTFPATMGMDLKTQATSSFEFPFDTVISIGGINATITKARINATILDTSIIDGYGTAEFVSGSVPVLRNVQTMKMSFAIEVYAKLFPFLPAAWVALPASVLDPSLLPVIYSKNLSFWANGKKSAVAEFTLDSSNNVTSANYLKEMLVTGFRPLVSVRPDFEFQASPNPALNDVSFSSDAILKKVKIFSLTGQKMLEKDFQSIECHIQVDALTNGVYVAELENEKGGKSQKRLIINR
ncbi:MAG TPA: T9SS type A sorting domain-containing protein [Catalimonadaceae bacterium]|nr:T9SS type A sorting domain-containing protein [Catalimonadaceae bacterium]